MELHGRCSPTLGLRPEVRNVAEHRRERHLSAHDAGVPCIAGAPFGHIRDQWTIPLGAIAELDADSGELVGPLVGELVRLAGWLGLDDIEVGERGDLAGGLRECLGGDGRCS